jgi:hypothetical protein
MVKFRIEDMDDYITEFESAAIRSYLEEDSSQSYH